MLTRYQRAFLKAYGKAQLLLKSHAVASYDFGNGDSCFLILSCEELWTSYRCRQENHEVLKWFHPHTTPCWAEYDISEDDFSEYMKRRFSLLYK